MSKPINEDIAQSAKEKALRVRMNKLITKGQNAMETARKAQAAFESAKKEMEHVFGYECSDWRDYMA